MTPLEHELVRFIARFAWRPMSWQRRAMNDFVRRLDGERSGAEWTKRRDITERERHLLYRLAWEKLKQTVMPSPLLIPVKEWLAAHPKPPTRAEQRKAERVERARAKAEARPAEEPRLL